MKYTNLIINKRYVLKPENELVFKSSTEEELTKRVIGKILVAVTQFGNLPMEFKAYHPGETFPYKSVFINPINIVTDKTDTRKIPIEAKLFVRQLFWQYKYLSYHNDSSGNTSLKNYVLNSKIVKPCFMDLYSDEIGVTVPYLSNCLHVFPIEKVKEIFRNPNEKLIHKFDVSQLTTVKRTWKIHDNKLSLNKEFNIDY